MPDVSEMLSKLSPEKRELLMKALLAKSAASAQPQAIRPRSGEGPAPLSYSQRRLWFMAQLEPDNPFYNTPIVRRLKGQLDVDALERALTEIVRRHESLRTVFPVDGEQPFQMVLPPQPFALGRIEVSEEKARQLIVDEIRRPFDLARGPLFRGLLVQTRPDEHLLALALHHICTDGPSLTILFRELAALYEAFSAGRQSPLQPLPVQFADYALWQRERLEGTALAPQLSYWRDRLAALEPQMLPTDRPRPAEPTYNGAKHTFSIAPDLAGELKSLSQREGATLFMTLMAAFQALLFRYTNQPDVAVTTAVATRPQPELEGLIGFFTNTLVIRTDLGGQPSFRALLARVKGALLGAFANQDVPFEKLAEELNPDRSTGAQPFTPISFVMNKVEQEISLAGLETRREVVDLGTTMNDLTLVIEELPAGLVGTFQFNTDLFDSATVERMSTHLLTLLRAVVADPEVPVAKAQLLTEAERRLLIEEWNATDVPLPNRLVHQLIAEQADLTPDAIAVQSATGQLTYRELNRRANQLAHWLRAAGVGPESMVALSMERTPDLIVGILGALKAGAAYVPLDPAYPRERLAFMLTETQAPVILTQQRLLSNLPAETTRTLCLDSDWASEVRPCSDADPAPHPGLTLESPAYVFFTSGSTGKPKGTLVLHRGLLNHSQSVIRDYQLGPGDRITQFNSVSFDLSVNDIFPTLECGATLVLPPFDRLPTVAEFRRVLEQEQVTRIMLPTAYWHEWAADMDSVPATLRTVWAGGEAASFERWTKWRRIAGDRVEWVNIYGPCETTVFSTVFRTPPGADVAQIPIGRPIANTRIYILDEHRQPVPVGVPGEIYIGGAGVSRGYLGRPDLTEQRYLPDPFHPGTPDAPARMYRTGDLGRYLPDGNILFLGRADHQVKVRGFRIELAEIEAVLSEHPAIHEAVVRPTTAGDSLVAYFIPAAQPAPSGEAIGAYLKQHLPAYMVPGAYVPMQSWPMTPSGKVDRRALPAVEVMQTSPAESFVAPSTQVEQVIASIWEELLHRERIGLTADFFDLGGHSLMATQMASRLREAFAVEVPLKALFQCSTVGALARWVEAAMQEARGVAITPMLTADRSQPLPLSYAQQRLWFIDQLDPGNPAWNIPMPLRLEGALAIKALEAAFGEVIRRHEALRTRFAVVEGQTVQVIDPPAPFVLQVTDLEPLAADERQAEVKRLVAKDSSRRFDLARGPLIHAELLRLSDREHVLLLNVHHIVADGWSLGVLTRELTALYTAYAAGEAAAPLPENLPVQYADFAAWQRQWLQGDLLETQLAYWTKQLDGIPAVIDLPTDRPRPPVPSGHGSFHQFRLSRPLSEALRALSRREGATLFMTLLAAFQTLLHRYSRQDDICVGTPIAGRRRVEVEGLIGFFLNTLVLRADLSDRPTFRQLLRQVRETTLSAYTHQDIPFEMLLEALQPERTTAHAPIVQTVFVLQNTPGGELRLPGLTWSPLEFERDKVKADLSLSLTETEDGLAAELGYNTDLFDQETALRMAAHFEMLLTAVAANPDVPISQVSFMTESERRLMLYEWNATAQPLPDKPVYQLIEEHAVRTPDALAVDSSTGRLTYAELNRKANQLAHWLRAAGVRPESLVAIAMERSPEMIVGMLGVMKAGGAYVPLDPAYPPERLAFMVADTQAPVILTQQRLLSALPPHGARTLCLDADWASEVSLHSDTSPEVAVTLDNTAYVIYTSGSTGRPKGVLMTHRGLLNHNMFAVREYGMGPKERMLQASSISFDISVEEIFPALLSGGTLVLLPFERLPSIAEFRRMLEQERISAMNLPTAYWHEWVAELVRAGGTPSVPKTLHHLVVGGEKASAERFAQWRQIAGEGVELLNTYGPTETAMSSTIYRARPGEVPAEVPIGRPFHNTRLYLLDENREPVPIGVPGELYIGGAGVAKGYLNLPDQTAERFLPDPFVTSTDPTARMYRTGDLARWLADGSLQFLGRADNQVKVRGFRIELSEVEVALSGHPAIQEALVLANKETDTLVAYVIPTEQPGPSEDELRSYLKERLPAYMVPAFYIPVEKWPKTPGGKVDRKALPSVKGRTVQTSATFVAPGTRLEQVIASIWQEVLHQDQIGVHDNFFDLGGQSLLLIRVHSRLCEALQRDLAMVDLFRHPTISSLARHLAAAGEILDFHDSEERADNRREALKRQREARLGSRGRLTRAGAQDEEAQDD